MDSPYGGDVAAEVRAEMARQRVSQTALADRLDVSQAYVSRRLTGDVPFDVEELREVAFILGVRVEQFITGTPAAAPDAERHPVPQRRRRSSTPPGRRGRARRRPLDQLEQRGE